MAEPSGLIPIGQAARLLMISEERIRQLVKKVPPKTCLSQRQITRAAIFELRTSLLFTGAELT